jgi:hypothetical protein
MANSPTLIVEWFVELVVKPLVEQGKIEQVEIPNLSATPSPEPA